MKNETTIDKAERMAENMMISWAIQEAINAKAVPISPEQSQALDQMIVELTTQFKPAEA